MAKYEVTAITKSGIEVVSFTNKAKAYDFARAKSKNLNCLVCDVRQNKTLIQTFYKGVKKLWKD